MEMQPATYQTVIGHEFELLTRPPQATRVPTNAAALEVPRWIQHHAAQLDQCNKMVNAEDIIKQKLLYVLNEICFKGQRQYYINYDNSTLAGLILHLYDDHGIISPTDIEESEKN